MGGSVQSNSSQASSSQSDSIESRIAALQNAGYTRICPDGKPPPGVVVEKTIKNAVGQIANNLHDILADYIKARGVSTKGPSQSDSDFLNDVISNVKAVLSDRSNSLENMDTSRLEGLLELVEPLIQWNLKSIPKIKQALSEDQKAHDICLKNSKKPHVRFADENSLENENIPTLSEPSTQVKKKQPLPVQMGPGDAVIDDKKFPLVTEESLEEDMHGVINLSRDPWMTVRNERSYSLSTVKDPEALEILRTIKSDPILRN